MKSLRKLSRRKFLASGGVVAASAAMAGSAAAQGQKSDHGKHSVHGGGRDMSASPGKKKLPLAPARGYATPKGNDWYARTVDPDGTYEPGMPGTDYTPVHKPNGTTVPWKIVDLSLIHI